ncbi:unnamed protein product [Musa acuminata subsp. malaccensis]|uniref:U-box domain-containing protein n=1 Tax=Musa acuminata subsp. malaccensis TaxID=214687 RepID=A0A804HMS7_MUSAM|nr:unnamed protein product [Musa acuminata subsp. malaccensis]
MSLESTSACACDEALSILYSLQFSEEGLLNLVKRNVGMIDSLTTILRQSSYQSRAHTTLLLESILGLYRCAEGGAALVGHAAGIPIVVKKILQVASERAVRILHSVAKHSATPGLLQEMLQTGVACKLCLVLRVECVVKTKEKAREKLRPHSRVWRSSPCLSPPVPAFIPYYFMTVNCREKNEKVAPRLYRIQDHHQTID